VSAIRVTTASEGVNVRALFETVEGGHSGGVVATGLELGLVRLWAHGWYLDLFWNWLWEEVAVAENVVPVQR
jgi:hypothetical protein